MTSHSFRGVTSIGLLFSAFFIGETVAQSSCLQHDEFMAELVNNYRFSQTIFAARCDVVVEGKADPTIKRFVTLSNRVHTAHQKEFENFTRPLNGLIARKNMTPGQYMMARIAQIDKQIDALGGVNKEKCELFYEELISRQKDWNRIMAGVIAEYLTRKDEYLCKP